MSICNRCNKEVNCSVLYAFDYPTLCHDCYDELVEQRDMKTVDQLLDKEVIYTLNPEQIVKNFVKYFAEYKKNPSHKLYNALWQIRCWAAHEDHTASCTINEICKWQGFSWAVEEHKWREK